jgi:D-alanyl-D-alanine carboxypeptidase
MVTALRAIVCNAALFISLSVCQLSQADIKFNDETIGRIDALISSRVTWRGDTPSYSILIDQGGKIVYERNTGFADIGNRIPATRDTVYKIGSITKSFTALAILQLVERGGIDLDSTVSQHLIDFEGSASEVTVRQLLTHTSGITNYTALPEAQPIMSWAVTSREDIVALFREKSLEFEPGTHYSYSNSGYYLLGLIVETASGKNYFDYLKTAVFDPLGLKSTHTGDYEEIVMQQARGYTVTSGGFANAAPVSQLTPFSAGILDASAADLVKYRRAVFKSAATSEQLRDLITTTGTFPDGVKQRYALGALTISDFHGHRKWGHSGSITGFASYHDYFPDDDITVVVLVNANGAPISPGSLAVKMAREIYSVPQPEDTEVRVTEKLLESYVGRYEMRPFIFAGANKRIVLNDGVLQLQINDDDENPALIPLFARSDDEFVLAIDDEIRLRFISESGQVTGLELFNADGAMPAFKLP